MEIVIFASVLTLSILVSMYSVGKSRIENAWDQEDMLIDAADYLRYSGRWRKRAEDSSDPLLEDAWFSSYAPNRPEKNYLCSDVTK